MIKVKNYLLFLLMFVLFFSFFSFSQAAGLRDAFNNPDDGPSNSPLAQVSGGAGYQVNSAENLVSKVIETLLSLLGVIFVGLMVYGGYLWMTDRGNEDQVKKAKDLIASAVIGLIIVMSAYAISYFVISKFSAGALK